MNAVANELCHQRMLSSMNAVVNELCHQRNDVAKETAILFATAGKFMGKPPLRIAVANGTANLFATAGKPVLIIPNANSTLSQKCTFLNFWFSTR